MTLPDARTAAPDHARSDRERAFAALFRHHFTALCRFAGRLMGNDAQAEDIVQDVFLYVWDRHDILDESTPSRAYLYRAVHNAALNRLRHERVARRWADGEPSRRDTGPSLTPAVELEREELAAAVQRAIERLPQRARLVYTLSRQEQLSYTEIAATLGISVKTVENQMARAFRHLRVLLASYLGAVSLLLL